MHMVMPYMLHHQMDQFILMVFILHADEIHQNHAGQVAETQLPRDFSGCFHINAAVRLFWLFPAAALPRIDIDTDEGFGLFDDEIGTAL
jgi:hypothetical protein